MRITLLPGLFLCIHAFGQGTPNPAVEQVNPFIGTGGHGHTFPGACVPNGLVQLSPDTRPDPVEWDGCGGYHYSDSLIHGFSHTHLSGTGVADLCDVLVMPMSGSVSLDPKEYRSRFSHANETAHAGYYRVLLEDDGIEAELTATAHVGVHRYVFPKGAPAHLVIDLEHRDVLTASSIVRSGANEVVGERRSSSWARDQRVFYCMRFSHPFEDVMGVGGLAEKIDQYSRSKDHISFGDLRGEPLVVKVGISAVSIEGARANLEAEAADLGFDEVRRKAEAAWNEKLNKIRVEGGSAEEHRIFYTALYHSYVAPYVFSDVDGKYRGMDGEVHHADHPVYTVFSLWDTFRALHPLMTILEPDMTADWIRTFLLNYQQGGKLPVWELWGNETDCMIGYHSVSVIADAYMKNIRGFDAELALEAMVASAMADDPCLAAYRMRGYISSEDCAESVSKTLEYAYDDWCIAQMAREMGKDSIADVFLQRSRNWQNLFDPGTRFFRPRRNGGFIAPFDPYEVNFHFTEANAWQYSLFAPHDVEYLMHLHGGLDPFHARLDSLFTTSSHTTGREQADITGLIGQYAHGNEPSHHMAALYGTIPARASAEARTHEILTTQYADRPDGLSGNEDCGQMSAWYVMNSIGLYQIAPGRPSYSITAPLFDRVTIATAKGPFVINAPHEAAGAFHLGADTAVDGSLVDTPEVLEHADLRTDTGMDLAVTVSPAHWPIPTRQRFERDLADTQDRAIPAPIIQAGNTSFSDALPVTISSIPGPWRCTWTAEEFPDAAGKGKVADSPLILTRTGSVTASCVDPTGRTGPTVMAGYSKIEHDLRITLESDYANQYSAGGDKALIDGIRGGADFRTGAWQGYQGQDVLLTIDLGKVMTVDSIGLGILQDSRSWIWYPEYVDIAWSTNKRMWSSTMLVPNVSRQSEESMNLDLWTGPIGKRAQYIKIMAKNAGPCPDWHLGAGGASWIFLDEVLIRSH